MADAKSITEEFISSSAVNSSALSNAKKSQNQEALRNSANLPMKPSFSAIATEAEASRIMHPLICREKRLYSAVPVQADRYRASTALR